MYKILYLFLMFFIYSFIGYICECIYCSINDKKIVYNRGFFIGPYLPIYGVGVVLIILLFNKLASDPLLIFLLSACASTLVEYIASFVMEKVFNARWWDYSDKKININGRVCLRNTLLFGLGGVASIYVFNPFINKFLLGINLKLFYIISIILLIVFILDLSFSIKTIYKIRKGSKLVNKDISKQINDQVRKILEKNTYFMIRMLRAYPKIDNFKKYSNLKKILEKKLLDRKLLKK